jgi:transposase-like protein
MAKTGTGTTLIDVARELGTDEQCLAYLEAKRWPGGVACLKCGSLKVSKTASTVKNRKTGKVSKTRYLYQCIEEGCLHQFTATTGTIFHDSHLSLTKWFMAVALFCNAKKSLSALQLQRDLGIGSYRTAWYLAHRIRKAMEEKGGGGLFAGRVEMDETYIGGKYDKRRSRERYEKQGVIGFVERSSGAGPSKVRALALDKSSGKEVRRVVRANVSKDAFLFTDTASTYKALDNLFFRYQVNHSQGEYVRGDIHTNSIEGFWSLFKRGIVGQYHQITIKHVERYLAEFSFRFNNRDSANLFGQTVGRMVETEGMPYKELVSE